MVFSKKSATLRSRSTAKRKPYNEPSFMSYIFIIRPESKAIVDNYGEVAVGKICEILPEETETVVVFGHAMGLAAMALQVRSKL